jgi:predicted Na+-dependent transporter
MKEKLIWSVFWALVGVPILIVVVLVGTRFPPFGQSVGGFAVNFVPAVGLVFLGLGATLTVLTVKAKIGGMLNNFLLLTGASALGLPVFGILHNLVSALLNTEEPVFFIIAIIVCPIGFLVGAIGSIVLAIKRNKRPGSAKSNATGDTP